jgi:hypothetical protein
MALRNGPIGAAQAEECLRILDEIRSLENRLIELGRPDYAPLRADMAEWSTPEATR